MNYITTHQKPPLSFPTLSGSVVTFNSQYAGLPLKSHKIALTATQSGSGTPSPSNPRPITGYSAINISHSDADTSNPTVYTITIGSTIYGGEYDARTGVLTVTHKGVDLGSLNWSDVNSTNDTSTTGLSGTIKPPPTNNNKVNMLCTSFEVVARNAISDITIMVNTSSTIIIRNSGYAGYTGAQVKSALSGVYIAYELVAPTTIQLPPCPIDTLEGVNNIWADTGDTTLQYPKFG